MKQAHHSIFQKECGNISDCKLYSFYGLLPTCMYIHSLSNNWMHFKRNFAYTIKEPETSIRDNEVTVSRDMIPYTFLKETQRKILRLNKPPPLFKEEF